MCSNDALAYVLRYAGWRQAGDMLGLAANLALPSVILVMLYGQTRLFFAMARDGLPPSRLASIHPRWKTPHVVTMITSFFVSLAAAFFPVGQLADISNAGTLFAFLMVAVSVLVLRIREPERQRPFRTPFVWLIAPLTAAGCIGLFLNLPFDAQIVLPIWGVIGIVLYFSHGYWRSKIGHRIGVHH